MSSSNEEQQPSQEIPKILRLNEIQTIVQEEQFQKDLMQVISNGFVAFERGDFFAAPIQTLGAPPMAPFLAGSSGGFDVVDGYAGQTCVKSGYFRNHTYYVIKVASGGFPFPNSGLMQVFSQTSGRLVALLLDEGVLTELRTAAVGALAFQLFGPKKPTMQAIGILGTGVQARYQLKMLASVTTCRTVVVWGRSLEKALGFQREMEKDGWTVSVAGQADDLLKDCDLIVTTTCAREPVLGGAATNFSRTNIRAKLITCIGADAPGKQELHPNLVAQASLKVADSLEQTRTRGEFQQYCAEYPDPTDLVSLGHAIEDSRLHRRSSNDGSVEDDRLIIFDSSGVSLQDCAIAQMVIDSF